MCSARHDRSLQGAEPPISRTGRGPLDEDKEQKDKEGMRWANLEPYHGVLQLQSPQYRRPLVYMKFRQIK